jgi:hypothetical protein
MTPPYDGNTGGLSRASPGEAQRNFRFPKKRPMNAHKTTVAMIAAGAEGKYQAGERNAASKLN